MRKIFWKQNKLRPPSSRDLPVWKTGLVIFAATWGTFLLAAFTHHIAAIWVANGLLLAMMLPLKRKQWGWHGLAAFLAMVVAARLVGIPWIVSVAIAVGNLTEVGILLWATGESYDAEAARFRIPTLRFLLWTLVAVGVPAGLAGLLELQWGVRNDGYLIALRFLGHELGILLVIALALLLRRGAMAPLFKRGTWPETQLSLMAMAVASLAVFGQNRFPLLYLLLPVMILIVFRGGLALGMLSLVVMMPISIVCSAMGRGPMAMLPGTPIELCTILLQIFLLVALTTVYPVGRALASRQRLENLYNTLQVNARVVVTRTTLDGRRTYISPSVTQVLGWEPEEMAGPARKMIHPDDLPAVEELLQELSSGLDNTIFAYRALHKSGGYVWMEAQVQVVRDAVTGEPRELISTAMDISERKGTETELQKAYDNLERLAAMDGLTGLTNRRIFDETLEVEWRRAQREESTISLLMLDVDYFKALNDALGHVAGDETLRSIARALNEVIQRPGDMAARYGGEEFVVLLPVTDEAGAMHVARKIAVAISRLGLEHVASPAGYVTASIGVSSCAPGPQDLSSHLVEAADRALYTAKRNGRNRIEVTVMAPEDLGAHWRP